MATVAKYIAHLKEKNYTTLDVWKVCEKRELKGTNVSEQIEEYVTEFINLYEQKKPWCHIIVKDAFYPLVFFHPLFTFGGFSCTCDCNVVLRGRHHHMIGYWDYNPRNIRRIFAEWRAHLGPEYAVKKGSNLDYVIKPLTTFQHFLATFFYVCAEQKIFKKGDFNQKTKHGGFFPFGQSKLATYSKDIPPEIKWQKIHDCLGNKGYKKESEQAIREYKAYVAKRRAEKEAAKLKGDQTRYILTATKRLEQSGNSSGTEREILNAVISARAGVAPDTEDTYPLGHCDTDCGRFNYVVETKEGERICRRHPRIPNIPSYHISDSRLLQYISDPLPDLDVQKTSSKKSTLNPTYVAALRRHQEEDLNPRGSKQQRQEFPGEEFESTRL